MLTDMEVQNNSRTIVPQLGREVRLKVTPGHARGFVAMIHKLTLALVHVARVTLVNLAQTANVVRCRDGNVGRVHGRIVGLAQRGCGIDSAENGGTTRGTEARGEGEFVAAQRGEQSHGGLTLGTGIAFVVDRVRVRL